jgi:hypothetical protein
VKVKDAFSISMQEITYPIPFKYFSYFCLDLGHLDFFCVLLLTFLFKTLKYNFPQKI